MSQSVRLLSLSLTSNLIIYDEITFTLILCCFRAGTSTTVFFSVSALRLLATHLFLVLPVTHSYRNLDAIFMIVKNRIRPLAKVTSQKPYGLRHISKKHLDFFSSRNHVNIKKWPRPHLADLKVYQCINVVLFWESNGLFIALF